MAQLNAIASEEEWYCENHQCLIASYCERTLDSSVDYDKDWDFESDPDIYSFEQITQMTRAEIKENIFDVRNGDSIHCEFYTVDEIGNCKYVQNDWHEHGLYDLEKMIRPMHRRITDIGIEEERCRLINSRPLKIVDTA